MQIFSIPHLPIPPLVICHSPISHARSSPQNQRFGIIYQCSVPHRPAVLSSEDPEVGPKGIQWLPIASLNQAHCTSRTWKALQAAKLIE